MRFRFVTRDREQGLGIRGWGLGIRRRQLGMAIGVILLTASAAPATPVAPTMVSASSTVQVRCGTSFVELPVTWYFPVSGTPAGLVWLQHGFFRANENVGDLGARLAQSGFITVAITIPSFQERCNINNVTTFLPNVASLFGYLNASGSPLLASARSAAAAVGITLPRLPDRFVFSGHSAGGAAVTLVAGEYVTRFPIVAARLAGLVLLDPVENAAGSIQSSLPALTGVPMRAISAPGSACNANSSGTSVLLQLARPFVGFELTSGSHCDAEGASGNPVLCGLVCGAVRRPNVALLQLFTVGWSADLLLGRTTGDLYPGGTFYDALVEAGWIRTY